MPSVEVLLGRKGPKEYHISNMLRLTQFLLSDLHICLIRPRLRAIQHEKRVNPLRTGDLQWQDTRPGLRCFAARPPSRPSCPPTHRFSLHHHNPRLPYRSSQQIPISPLSPIYIPTPTLLSQSMNGVLSCNIAPPTGS
ncbi:hypothetical protein M3J09_007760 [Ascochyta lentis]